MAGEDLVGIYDRLDVPDYFRISDSSDIVAYLEELGDGALSEFEKEHYEEFVDLTHTLLDSPVDYLPGYGGSVQREVKQLQGRLDGNRNDLYQAILSLYSMASPSYPTLGPVALVVLQRTVTALCCAVPSSENLTQMCGTVVNIESEMNRLVPEKIKFKPKVRTRLKRAMADEYERALEVASQKGKDDWGRLLFWATCANETKLFFEYQGELVRQRNLCRERMEREAQARALEKVKAADATVTAVQPPSGPTVLLSEEDVKLLEPQPIPEHMLEKFEKYSVPEHWRHPGSGMIDADMATWRDNAGWIDRVELYYADVFLDKFPQWLASEEVDSLPVTVRRLLEQAEQMDVQAILDLQYILLNLIGGGIVTDEVIEWIKEARKREWRFGWETNRKLPSTLDDRFKIEREEKSLNKYFGDSKRDVETLKKLTQRFFQYGYV